MLETPSKLSVRLEKVGIAESGGLIFHFRSSTKRADEPHGAPDRLACAAAWALDLDDQYRELILTGRSPRVIVPKARRTAVGAGGA